MSNKINLKKYMFYIALIIIVSFTLIISGCGPKACSKDKVWGCKCEFTSDCPKAKQFFKSECDSDENICKQTPLPDVCGNGLEDKGENSCNCPKDVTDNKCEGRKVLETIRTKDIETKYLQYMCDDSDKCILNFNEADVKEIPVTYELKTSDFRLEGRVYYNQPFDVDKDKIRVEFELKDYNDNIVLPIKITGMKLKGGEILYGINSETKTLSTIGSSITFYLPLDYDLKKVEEELSPSLVVDYEYSSSRGTEININRNSYTKKFSNDMTVVEIGEEKPEVTVKKSVKTEVKK